MNDPPWWKRKHAGFAVTLIVGLVVYFVLMMATRKH
jgi:hypothetical protein